MASFASLFSLHRPSATELCGEEKHSPEQMPEQTSPEHGGEPRLLQLPDEVLHEIFFLLDLSSLTRCFRLCKSINTLLNCSAGLKLRHTLLANGLCLNPAATTARADLPNQMPMTSGALLSKLRERLTRFRNLTPSSTSHIHLGENESRLYEYLEGVLLRSVSVRRSTQLAVYDLRKETEWEDTADTIAGDEEAIEDADLDAMEVRTVLTFPFNISEMAVDPGQDLLVIAECRNRQMFFHLLSLATGKPHPRAKDPILAWPVRLLSLEIHLDFQICDDGLYILSRRMRGVRDKLVGWQWTTGRLHVSIEAESTESFQAFVLLSPSCLIIPTVISRIHSNSNVQDQIDDPSDLYWTHHLHIYTFQPFDADTDITDHKAALVTVIDLPTFRIDLLQGVGPPALSIRTDPPPRHTFPTHPEHEPPPFQPVPTSGVAIIEVYCDMLPVLDITPHYVIAVHKTTLLELIPSATAAPLLKVTWDEIAPRLRMFGPELTAPEWVCYVYQNRYVAIEDSNDSDDEDEMRTPVVLMGYDFDPLRTRKEACSRRNARGSSDPAAIEGDVDGVELVISETVLPHQFPLDAVIRTGSDMPFMITRRTVHDGRPLIDSERVLIMDTTRGRKGVLEVLDL